MDKLETKPSSWPPRRDRQRAAQLRRDVEISNQLATINERLKNIEIAMLARVTPPGLSLQHVPVELHQDMDQLSGRVQRLEKVYTFVDFERIEDFVKTVDFDQVKKAIDFDSSQHSEAQPEAELSPEASGPQSFFIGEFDIFEDTRCNLLNALEATTHKEPGDFENTVVDSIHITPTV